MKSFAKVFELFVCKSFVSYSGVSFIVPKGGGVGGRWVQPLRPFGQRSEPSVNTGCKLPSGCHGDADDKNREPVARNQTVGSRILQRVHASLSLTLAHTLISRCFWCP